MAEGDEWPQRLDLTPLERTIRNAIIAELDRQQADEEEFCTHAATPISDDKPHANIDGDVNLDKLARAVAVALELSDAPAPAENRAQAVQSDPRQTQ